MLCRRFGPIKTAFAMVAQVRSQLEALLAEKAALAAENERLARENGGLQELLRYSVQVGAGSERTCARCIVEPSFTTPEADDQQKVQTTPHEVLAVDMSMHATAAALPVVWRLSS